MFISLCLGMSGYLWVCLCHGLRAKLGGGSQAVTPTHMLGLSPGAIYLPGLRCLQQGGESGTLAAGGWGGQG